MMIHELCEGERPREKMISRGAFSLSDGELLAILLRSGLKGKSVVEVSQNLLGMCGGRLTRLFAMTPLELAKVPGIGSGKACSILAAGELGRRFMQEEFGLEKKPITTARMVFDAMIPLLKGAGREEFWVLYLNTAGYLLAKEKVTTGSGKSTAFDVRHVVKGALDRGAYSVVLVHNHPSGNPSPSLADIRQTNAFRDACVRFDICLADHVIVCDDAYFSLSENRSHRV